MVRQMLVNCLAKQCPITCQSALGDDNLTTKCAQSCTIVYTNANLHRTLFNPCQGHGHGCGIVNIPKHSIGIGLDIGATNFDDSSPTGWCVECRKELAVDGNAIDPDLGLLT